MSDANLILEAGALMLGGLLATLAAGRLRVPGLVLFIGLGMAIGSDGTGWIRFDDYELARTIGVIALALILFEGGLSAGIGEIRPVLGASLSLAFVGTLLTAAIAGVAAHWLFDFSLLEGLLLGSIISATDGAAIFGLLRESALPRRVARTLEGETGFNDPISILLVVGLIDWIQLPDYGLGDMTLLFLRELGIGLAVGLAVGWLAVQGLRRTRLGTEAGYPVGTIAVAALAYGAASSLHGSGFLAVYLAGLALGSVTIPAQRAVRIFHQGLAWVAQVTMFLVLGLLVFPSQLNDVALEGTVLALVLVLVARPLATLVATAAARFSLREQAVLAWAGLRGAVPVVLATFPVIDGVEHSLEFFNIVFFAVLLSTLVQGATFEPFARRLGLVARGRVAAPPPRPVRPSAQISTTGPWRASDGDPAYPKQVAGIRVARQLATRVDRPGALVALADGRYATTGPIASVGSASAVQRLARRRLARAEIDAERAWWREVIGMLAR
jgi:cell volume regulation protein A